MQRWLSGPAHFVLTEIDLRRSFSLSDVLVEVVIAVMQDRVLLAQLCCACIALLCKTPFFFFYLTERALLSRIDANPACQIFLGWCVMHSEASEALQKQLLTVEL